MPRRLLLLVPVVLLGACRGAAPSSAPATVSMARTGAVLFTDSAVYRMRCKEADTIRTLATVPQHCTPRDQRQPIKIF